jgi:hypothetical protein
MVGPLLAGAMANAFFFRGLPFSSAFFSITKKQPVTP